MSRIARVRPPRGRLPASVAGIALLVGLATASCGVFGSSGSASPRLVLLLLPCTVTESYLSIHDESVRYTPHLDRLAAEALVFENHLTEAGQSGIAYASIFTGGDVLLHGVYAHPRRVDRRAPVITEAFRDAGYETFFWASQGMARAALDGRGVSEGNEHRGVLDGTTPEFRRLLERLASDGSHRALVVSAFSVTHAPYSAQGLETFCSRYPAECEGVAAAALDDLETYLDIYARNRKDLSYDRDTTIARLGLSAEQVTELDALLDLLYRSAVARLDRILGGVIGAVDDAGLRDESLLVVTADHGEVMRHERPPFRYTHGHMLAPEVLNVPFVLRAPGLGLRVGRYEGVTRSIDIFPTLAALAGLPPAAFAAVRGVDLSAAIRGEAPEPRLVARSHTSLVPDVLAEDPAHLGPLFARLYPRSDPRFSWVSLTTRDLVYKYRNTGEGSFVLEVFDRISDFAETTDLFDPRDASHLSMLAEIETYKAAMESDHARRLADGGSEAELSQPEQVELLRSLGYVD